MFLFRILPPHHWYVLFKRSWFFLFFSFLISGFSAEINEQVEDQLFYKQKIENQGWAFLSKEQQDQFQLAKSEALKIIQTDFSRWVKAATETELLVSEQKTLLRKLENLNAINCKDKCTPCQEFKTLGCAHLEKKGQLDAPVVLVSDITIKSKLMGELLLKSLAEAASIFVSPELKPELKKKQKQAAISHFKVIKIALEKMLSQCPGPYEQSTLEFLAASKHVIKPNESLLECGKKYLFGKRISGEILRADRVAQVLLCRTESGKPLFQKFGKKEYLLILDGSCSGDEPLHMKNN